MKKFLIFVVFIMCSTSVFSKDFDVSVFEKMNEESVERKKYFFINKINNLIVRENIEIMTKRKKLRDNELTDNERYDLCQKLRIESNICLEKEGVVEKFEKLDIIPPSIAIAQAAIESNWGTSRFAQQGNNLFGQWCFTNGCGIVPERRAAGGSHEVQSFETIEEAVKEYARNLNSHPAYKEFRRIRNADKVNGYEAASGLGSYSAQGEVYIEKIKNFIEYNNLKEFDKKFDF